MSTNITLIETKTVGSGGISSVVFSNIPQTYTDLKISISGRTNRNSTFDNLNIGFNSSQSNFTGKVLAGYGTSGTEGASAAQLVASINSATSTANVFSTVDIYISNYTSSNYKSFSADAVNENIDGFAVSLVGAGLWSSTSAISSIEFYPVYGTLFTELSTFSLYGISSVTSTPKATGGVIYQDSTYYYHAFPYTSTFTPTQSLTADVLVVAGGGGGGGQNPGGGGGAGGLRAITSQSLTTTAYTVTVGAGGAASAPSDGTQGGNSSFAGSGFTTFSATGGGYGKEFQNPGVSGGSGSGASGWRSSSTYSGGAGNAGSYSPVEGYAGGNFTNNGGGTNYFVSAGGGGAGGVGGSVVSNTNAAGNGGVGTDTYNSINFSSWLTATSTGVGGKLAGGGGGGIGSGTAGTGVNGGGGGGVTGAATAGTANTGGGGGGGYPGGAGGSGLVIVRYAK